MSSQEELVIKVAMENSSFQQGVSNLNRQLRVIQSEFKNSTSKIKENGTSLDSLKAKQTMLSQSIQVQSKIVEQYKNKLNSSKQTLTENAQKQVQLKEKIESTKAAYEQSKATLGENAEETKRLKKELSDLETEYSQNEEKIRKNNQAVENYTIKVNNAESRLNSLQSELQQTNSDIQSQESKWTQLSNKLDSIGSKFQAVGSKMSSIGKSMSTVLTTPILGVGAAAVKLGLDFESSMSNVQALTGVGSEKMAELESAARNAGATTSKSAKDAADALGYMALAGWDADTSMENLIPILRLSEGANMDLATCSDLVTDSMSALGLTTNELSGYLDICAQTQRKANTTAQGMLEAYIACGGTMKNLGVSTQESATALGVLANRGKKGSEAGNALNSIMINLTSGAGQAGVAMKKLGVNAYDNNGKFKGLKVVLDELNKKLSTCTDEQRDTYLAMIGGKTQIDTLNALLSGSSEEWNDLSGYIGNCKGSLEEVATTMQDNNKGSITQLSSALQELGLKVYDVLKPKIAALVETLQNITNALNSMNPKTAETIVTIAGLVAAIGPALFILGKIITLAGTLFTAFSTISGAIAVVTTGCAAATPAIGALATAFTFITGPVGIAIAAILAIGAGLAYAWTHCETFRTNVINIFNSIKEGITNAINGVSVFFTETIPGLITNITTWFYELPTKLQIVWSNLLLSIRNAWNNITLFFTQTIPSLINNIGVWFSQLPQKIGYNLGLALGKFVQWHINVFNYLVTAIPSLINNISTWFSKLPGRVWNWLVNTYNKTVQWGINMTNKAIETGRNFINNVIIFIKQLPGRVWTWLNNSIQKAIQFAKEFAQKGKKAADDFKNKLIEGIKSIPSKLQSLGKSIVEGIWKGISGAGGWLKKQVTGFCNGIVQGFKDGLKINSPAKVMIPIGSGTIEGSEVGMEKRMSVLKGKIRGFSNDIKDTFDTSLRFNNSFSTIPSLSFEGIQQSSFSSYSNFKDVDIKGLVREAIQDISNQIDVNVKVYNEIDSDDLASATTTKVIKEISRREKNNKFKKGK